MLIRDPYLQSAEKRPSSLPRHLGSIQPSTSILQQNQNLQTKLRLYQRDVSIMQRALNDRQTISHKLLNLHGTNNEYHQAMKLRNLDLNNRLNDLALQNELIQQANMQERFRSTVDRDQILRRYEEQTQDILSLKRTISSAMEQKEQLEGELSHVGFILDKETTKLSLELKEQAIRTQNMERTYKAIISTKDQEINSLHHRLRVYQDENRRLNQVNRTLQLTKNDKINNLSRIPDMESNAKSRYGGRSMHKENNNPNVHVQQDLDCEKEKNKRLMEEIERLKKQKLDFEKLNGDENQRGKSRSRQKSSNDKFEIAKSEGLIGSIVTLRNGINKEIFQVFVKSIREGEKRRQNSLVIFITNWKNLDIDRLQPYIQSYLQSRTTLKQIALYSSSKNHPLLIKIQECIPIHVADRKGRSKINSWILQTIQFTKNQRETGKKSLNNLLLFLFRMLTIQYRIVYPMQGKSYVVDGDVRNQLLHETVKAIKLLLEFK